MYAVVTCKNGCQARPREDLAVEPPPTFAFLFYGHSGADLMQATPSKARLGVTLIRGRKRRARHAASVSPGPTGAVPRSSSLGFFCFARPPNGPQCCRLAVRVCHRSQLGRGVGGERV